MGLALDSVACDRVDVRAIHISRDQRHGHLYLDRPCLRCLPGVLLPSRIVRVSLCRCVFVSPRLIVPCVSMCLSVSQCLCLCVFSVCL